MNTIKVKLPNLVIAGVVKGGTTSLYTYLSQHPDICASSVKETCYFSVFRYGQLDSRYRQAVSPFNQYKSYFSHCQEQKYIMEATPGYFEGGMSVIKEIKTTLGEEVKILIILREPIARLLSFFKYKKSMLALDKKLTIEQYIKQCELLSYSEKIKQENDTYWGLDGGFYANYLAEWLASFGKYLKVIFFDDLQSNSQELLADICSWLEIDYESWQLSYLKVENKSINYKNQFLQRLALTINQSTEQFWRGNPKIKSQVREIYYRINGMPYSDELKPETLEYLKELYKPYNKKLAAQLISGNHPVLPQWLQTGV
ncbi:hypothetical protein MiYa_03562 [Microcystis aeruginosa NIES-2519]|jgi:hypothetical protein|uniref:Sulfotransferase domain-containing protein n=1 Tax=Microcystis aeruginosa NIES-2519 TaxID=2303981 RepID=A0A5A5RAV2_MICAE|nr:sulfotransferase [Microcystis aeruginosa]MDB9393410.1 sulfotransferase [Microcystis aeruginosa CS-579]GCA72015.1 hypothetical protein MiYa_03562 [Microcystis aeruginosa NIES-2519]GCA85622.1 hypothetical protein MiHa_03606 [Microcystis aeruginosa NIES-2522]